MEFFSKVAQEHSGSFPMVKYLKGLIQGKKQKENI